MYEILTNLLPELSDSKAVGQWIADHKNDGSKEHPIQFPFVAYAEAVTKLEDLASDNGADMHKYNTLYTCTLN